MRIKSTLLFTTLVAVATVTGNAAHHEEANPKSVFKGAFLGNFDHTTEKILSLADTFSEDQYAWRPAEGIRSVKESLLHMAGANYFLATQLGATMPEDLNPWALESTIETKADTIETLKASIAFAHAAIENCSDEKLAETIDLFGNEAPRMSAALIIGAHANEHLGQLIAYARSIDVVPPWSK